MILDMGEAPFWFCAPSIDSAEGEFRAKYVAAQPFPHIVLDDFLPRDLAELCVREFPTGSLAGIEYSGHQQNKKALFNPEVLSPTLRALFYSFNSAPFIQFLENLTGIERLIPDPYFVGAGLHEVANGGHLSIHTDFNHHEQMDLERRINVLIYLNPDWKEEYGGCFEIWDRDVSRCCLRVAPIFNRCVIFNTSLISFHGNPEPIDHPAGASRRAIALYYYTATWERACREHTTLFKIRPRSSDAFDFKTSIHEIMNDVTPPLAMRALTKVARMMRRGLKRPTAMANPENP